MDRTGHLQSCPTLCESVTWEAVPHATRTRQSAPTHPLCHPMATSVQCTRWLTLALAQGRWPTARRDKVQAQQSCFSSVGPEQSCACPGHSTQLSSPSTSLQGWRQLWAPSSAGDTAPALHAQLGPRSSSPSVITCRWSLGQNTARAELHQVLSTLHSLGYRGTSSCLGNPHP